jgi:hypothetical protein
MNQKMQQKPVFALVSGVSDNIALWRTAFQVSTASGMWASNAVDGLVSTGSGTGSWTLPWWAVDLGSFMFVRGLKVTNDNMNRKS